MIFGSRSFPRILNRERPRIKYTKYNFFKAVGLEILFSLGVTHVESPKLVYSISFKTALARCAVHILPLGASVVVIGLNLVHLYLGQEFTGVIASQEINSFLLQLASKIQEMTIVASLTAIVLHEVREQLLHGPGVPLGALGGAFLFTSLSFLWSPGLWGAMRSHTNRKSKARLYTILLLSMSLAAVVGPSTATLIIPKPKWWLAGGAKLWFQGDIEDIYPLVLPSRNESASTLCSQANATIYPVCPSFGNTFFMERSLRGNFQIFNQDPIQKVERKLFFADSTEIIIPGGMNQVEYMSLQTSFRGADCQTGAVGPRLSESLKLAHFWHDFDNAAKDFQYTALNPSISEYKRRLDDIVKSITRIPMAKTACSSARNLSSTDTQVYFPVMVQDDCWSEEQMLNVDRVLEEQDPALRIKTSWIQLPDDFGSTSTGLVLQGPWDTGSNSRLVVGCSVTAGWGNGSIVQNPNWIWRGIPDYQAPWNRSFDNGHSALEKDISWQTIELKEEWLTMLSPPASNQSDQAAPKLDAIFESSGILQNLVGLEQTQETIWNQAAGDNQNRSVIIEHILSVVLVEALAREGSLNVLVPDSRQINLWEVTDVDRSSDFGLRIFHNQDPYIQPSSGPMTPVEATMTLYGLCFLADQSSEYISIAVLCTYIVLAVLHILRITITRKSSGSWHTLTELIALAHNSEPSRAALHNTGAGISELKTHGTIAVVRATQRDGDSASSAARLSLILKESDRNESELRLLTPDGVRRGGSSRQRRPSSGSEFQAGSELSTPSIKMVEPDEAYS